MSVDLGTDVSTYTRNDEGDLDLDPYFGEIAGPVAVGEAVMRRFETANGSLDDDPDAGDDIIEYLNSDLVDDSTFGIAHSLEVEALKDERVDAVDASATLDPATGRLALSIAGETGAGPFSLVLQSSGLSFDLLKVTA